MTMFDYSKLKGQIKEKFATQNAFAKALGLSKTSLSAKLNNRVEFSQSEMNKACEIFELSKDHIPVLFFTPKS